MATFSGACLLILSRSGMYNKTIFYASISYFAYNFKNSLGTFCNIFLCFALIKILKLIVTFLGEELYIFVYRKSVIHFL
jgi:hypothetical protein